MPTSKRADLSRVLPAVRCTARKQNGEPCKAMAARGANVCRVHGGSAPQVKAAARRRLDQAADVLVQRLLAFALDGDAPDNIALQAIRDALDRAGMAPKQGVEVEVKAPWEELLGDVAQITRAQHEAMKRGEFTPAPAQPPRALPPAREDRDDVLDAEVVEDPHEMPPDSTGECADRPSAPDWAEPPARTPTRQLATAEDAAAQVAAANRVAKGSQNRHKPR